MFFGMNKQKAKIMVGAAVGLVTYFQFVRPLVLKVLKSSGTTAQTPASIAPVAE